MFDSAEREATATARRSLAPLLRRATRLMATSLDAEGRLWYVSPAKRSTLPAFTGHAFFVDLQRGEVVRVPATNLMSENIRLHLPGTCHI